jgi:hypothetical protein
VNGACAQVDAAWMRTVFQHQVGPMFQPTVCVAAMTGNVCAKGNELKVKAFPQALAWFLANRGFITGKKRRPCPRRANGGGGTGR